MPTIKDVAEKAGITVTTVSRVMNNKKNVSAKTKKKVLDAIKELNYQPNEVARSLFNRKSNFIGVIVPDVKHQFFAILVSAIEFYASKYHYKIVLCDSYMDSNKEKDYLDMLRRNQVAGIIMGSHTLQTQDYCDLNLPLVAVERYLSESIPYVSSDNFTGGLLATNCLIDRGCKKLAHISGPISLNTPANKRREAFISVATSRNVEYYITETKLNSFDLKEYEDVITALFKQHPDIDGIFASNDMIAASIIRLANILNKDIPRDLKVIGYDDISIASLLSPSLTTIRQPIDQMGQRAVEIIINQIKGKEYASENVLPVSLIEREST